MTLFEHIENLCIQISDLSELKKQTKVEYYQNKTNPEDKFTSLEDAFKRELNLANYEKIVNYTSTKKDFIKEVFGFENHKITKEEIEKIEYFLSILKATQPQSRTKEEEVKVEGKIDLAKFEKKK